jgi:hypothetical protein
MDQGVSSALKSYYVTVRSKKIIAETDANNELTVHEFWQAFDILDRVRIVGVSWKQFSTRLINEWLLEKFISRCCSLL